MPESCWDASRLSGICFSQFNSPSSPSTPSPYHAGRPQTRVVISHCRGDKYLHEIHSENKKKVLTVFSLSPS